jgi:hypothetical protein
MRAACLLGVLLTWGCGAPPPHAYPAETKAAFHVNCPEADPLCACSWDRITRTVSPEDYVDALTRLEKEGRADPRLSQARLYCLDRT